MTRRSGYLLTIALASVLVPSASGRVLVASASPEPLLPAVVAAGAHATTAVLPNGAWAVELAPLRPGDVDPAVSPDGRRVAFVSERDGDADVYVADAASGEVVQVTRNRRPDRHPAWAPGGRRLVWESGTPGAADLFVARADGAGARRLLGGRGDDAEPSWSPDGSTIAFSSNRGGRRQLWAVPVTGGPPEQLAQIPGRAGAPSWSPSGDRIALVVEARGDSDVWVLAPASGTLRKVTRGAGRDSRPDWSPAGRHIAFARASAGRRSIWIVGADGTPRGRPLAGTAGLSDPDWSPTQRALVPRPDERLPDLDQRAPSELVVSQVGTRFRIGFASSTENRGRGPLVIRGVRSGDGAMTAHQVVERRGRPALLVRDVGRLHYELHSPHFHWHFQSFVRYELRRASNAELVVRDRKSGFCLIDRWGRASGRVPGTGPPRFVGDCGAGQPNARRVEEGTSVGYIDRYPAFFHGQHLDVTRLRAGLYTLVHRANPERAMRELRYSDDTASILVRLDWPNGRASAPRVVVLRRCETGELCPAR